MRLKDETGYQTLEAIAKADKFNRWMFETIRPFCSGHILEIGSGIGNVSQFFVQNNFLITLSDTDEFYVGHLKKAFVESDVLLIDLVHKSFNKEYDQLFEKFDTVISLNVLEHISDDELAIENCLHFLKPGGSLVMLVPAYSFLFSQMDSELKHYRRYTSKKVSALAVKKGLVVRKVFYFNALGIMAWLYGKLFRLQSIPVKNMKLYNSIVPFAKFMDKILFQRAGLSVILVAKKDL
jgi:SAM-dependent methyltransferase